MKQDFASIASIFEDDFQAMVNWSMTLPEVPEKQLTEKEKKFLHDFDESVEMGEPYFDPEDREIWSDMLEEEERQGNIE